MTTSSPLSLIQPDAIKLSLTAASGVEAVRELHASLARIDAVRDAAGFLRDLLARQRLGGSCLDEQIALPHTRTVTVERFVLAAGRSVQGVAFDGGHPAVRLVILIGVPLGATAEYLRWTAYLARALRNPPLRRALLAAPTAADFQSIWSLGILPPAS